MRKPKSYGDNKIIGAVGTRCSIHTSNLKQCEAAIIAVQLTSTTTMNIDIMSIIKFVDLDYVTLGVRDINHNYRSVVYS